MADEKQAEKKYNPPREIREEIKTLRESARKIRARAESISPKYAATVGKRTKPDETHLAAETRFLVEMAESIEDVADYLEAPHLWNLRHCRM